jgi:hypothetical protein
MHITTSPAVFVHCVYLENRESYRKGALVRTPAFHLYLQLLSEMSFVVINTLPYTKRHAFGSACKFSVIFFFLRF